MTMIAETVPCKPFSSLFYPLLPSPALQNPVQQFTAAVQPPLDPLVSASTIYTKSGPNALVDVVSSASYCTAIPLQHK